MKFSICIPNYNYGHYIGETIQSVLDQTYQNFEILISDNGSTDHSLEVIRSFKDDRIKLNINQCNVGFSENLDKAGMMATGDLMIMLSSDDVLMSNALETYAKIYNEEGSDLTWVGSAACLKVDEKGETLDSIGVDPELWKGDILNKDESIWFVSSDSLLSRCLHTMKNPFNFAVTVYPRCYYRKIGGYRGLQSYNPDKGFHWRLLSVADKAFYIMTPLLKYRWHKSNQASLQESSKALKYLVDEYLYTYQLDESVLRAGRLTRSEFQKCFIDRDIISHGLASLARGQREYARRIISFGKAAYPHHFCSHPLSLLFSMLLNLGPLGSCVANAVYKMLSQRFK